MSQSPSDMAFKAKYGHAPVKATTAKKGSRAELEELRAFKAAEEKRIASMNASHIEATGKPLPVKVQTQPVDAKASKRARMLASAKATHAAVQQIRADAGMSRIEFDQALFDYQFENYHGDKALRTQATDQNKLATAMTGLSGQKVSFKTPAQLAHEAKARSPEQQREALNQAILNQFRKM